MQPGLHARSVRQAFVSAQALTNAQPYPLSQAMEAVATRSSNSAIEARPGSA